MFSLGVCIGHNYSEKLLVKGNKLGWGCCCGGIVLLFCRGVCSLEGYEIWRWIRPLAILLLMYGIFIVQPARGGGLSRIRKSYFVIYCAHMFLIDAYHGLHILPCSHFWIPFVLASATFLIILLVHTKWINLSMFRVSANKKSE